MKKFSFILILVCSFFIGRVALAAPLTGANVDADYVYVSEDDVFTDVTTAANNATADDVTLGHDGTFFSREVYIGMNYYFRKAIINVSTAGIEAGPGAAVWEYWNGSEWASMEGLAGFSDGTVDFTTAGTNTVTFGTAMPTGWATTTVNGTSAYWVRARVDISNVYTPIPLAAQISTVELNFEVFVYQWDWATGITDLVTGDFTITQNTTTKYDFYNWGDGYYGLALSTEAHQYTVAANGYTTTTAVDTGILTSTNTSLEAYPNGDYQITIYKMDGVTPLGDALGTFSLWTEATCTTPAVDVHGVTNITDIDIYNNSWGAPVASGSGYYYTITAPSGYVDVPCTAASAVVSGTQTTENLTLDGDYKLKVVKMDGVTGLTGQTTSIFNFCVLGCGRGGGAHTDFKEVGSGVYQFAIPSRAAATFSVNPMSGAYLVENYVTSGAIVSGVLLDDTSTPVVLDGNYRLKVLKIDGATALTGLTTDAFTFTAAGCETDKVDFKEVGAGVYDFALQCLNVPTRQIVADGYVTNDAGEASSNPNSSTLVDDSGTPITMTGNYQLKVAKMDGSTGITGLSTGAFTFGRAHTDFYAVGLGVYKFAIPAGTATTRSVTVAGYVTNTGTSTSGATNTVLLDDSGTPITMSGVPAQLSFTVEPSRTTPGTALFPVVTVNVLDAANDLVTNATNSIAMALGTNVVNGTLSGTTPKSAVAGVATFSDLSIDRVGNDFTLVASASGLTSGTSAAFDVVERSSGGTSGGSSGGSGGSSTPAPVVPPPAPAVSAPTTPVLPIVQVPSSNKFFFTLLLRLGSRGNQVVELQKYLNAAKFNSGTADGIFGPKTKAAVIRFQLANKLVGDGIVGPLTRAVLNR